MRRGAARDRDRRAARAADPAQPALERAQVHRAGARSCSRVQATADEVRLAVQRHRHRHPGARDGASSSATSTSSTMGDGRRYAGTGHRPRALAPARARARGGDRGADRARARARRSRSSCRASRLGSAAESRRRRASPPPSERVVDRLAVSGRIRRARRAHVDATAATCSSSTTSPTRSPSTRRSSPTTATGCARR